MQLDWPQILGTIIAGIGAIGSLLFGGKWFLTQRRSILPTPSTSRSADAGPPPGAVEWVVDITTAMGASHASCILEALADGCCRDVARARRIEQLEATPITRASLSVPFGSQVLTEDVSQ